MSVEDAKRAVDIGCTGIMVSNHGGRQLDGSRAPFDQLAEIVDAVGGVKFAVYLARPTVNLTWCM